MMRGDTLPAAIEKSYERQAPRTGAVVSYPDGQIRRRVKLTEDIAAGAVGNVNVMLPLDVAPYFEDGQVPQQLYIPSNAPGLSNGDEVWASYEPSARLFFLLSGPVAGGATSVAVTTQIIPARSGTTPGGPVTVTKQISSPAGTPFADGDTVAIYSWVKTPSADPADETGGKLYIYIAQDENGVWWFIGQDCTGTPAQIVSGPLSANQVMTTTMTALAGTDIVIPADGLYQYSTSIEVNITGISGNTDWALTLDIFNVTDGVVVAALDGDGRGNPGGNLTANKSWALNLNLLAGKTYQMRAQRVAPPTGGTFTAVALNTSGFAATGHEVIGPIK